MHEEKLIRHLNLKGDYTSYRTNVFPLLTSSISHKNSYIIFAY
ncbi:hypothetical protein A1OE_900 [Candidatus Endolissoclinum faulkneri L2]|uniref:Uncharacterized protein n=1 Tax=Candidatus Endolissoclinum faulkneri L2 TaxID=1193729 RepID=K7YRB7_9PROT|nr:hypothetical protein A1OE_900 [Candidatus Endolissoclinum faulkneri L2]